MSPSTDTLTFQISALPGQGCTTVHMYMDGTDLGDYDANYNNGSGYAWTTIYVDVTTEMNSSASPHHVYWKYDNIHSCYSVALLQNRTISDGSGKIYHDQYHPIYDNTIVGTSGCFSPCGPPSEQINLSTGQFMVTGSGYVDHYIATSASGPPSSSYGGTNPAKKNTPTCTKGDPVNCASGNFFESVTDLGVPGRGRALSFTRTYNALAAAAATTTASGGVGWGWSSSYGDSLSFGASGVTVTQEDGATVNFTQSGSSYTAGPGAYATLVANTNGSWTFTLADQTADIFNSAGALVTETDRNAYQTVLTYSAGKLSAVTDPAGRQLAFTYNGSGQLTQVADALRSVSYGYDASGNLTTATAVDGGVTVYGYDTSHRLTTVTDPNKGVLTNVYDTSNRVTSQTDPLHRSTTWGYVGTTTTVTDPKGNATVEVFDPNGNLQSLTQGAGTTSTATSNYAYDQNGDRVGTQDPAGHVSYASYDANGNLLSSTDAMGRTTQHTYDSLNDPLTTVDPLLVTTSMTYDAHGNLLTTSTPLTGSSPAVAASVTNTYGDSSHPGDITAAADPDNHVSAYTYDAYGDLASSADPLGDKTLYCYNTISQRTKTIAPKGSAAGVTCSTSNPPNTVVTVPDAFGHPLSVTDALGHQTVNTYDHNGNLLTTKDPDTNLTTSVYDLDNEVTQTVRADSSRLNYGYDADGNQVTSVDGSGVTTTSTYDPLNRLSTTKDPLGRTTVYGYNVLGDQVTKQDPGGNCNAVPATGCTTMGYDADKELTSITYSDGVTPNVAETYDADGQRLTMTDGTGTSKWVWDSLHRLTSSTNGVTATVGYVYDLAANQTSISYPGGAGTVTQTYDAANRLHTVTDWAGHTTSFSYDFDSNLTGQVYPNTTTATITVNAADQLTGISDAPSASPTTPFVSFSYGRDAAGQVSGVTSTGVPADTNSYSYTQLQQLKGVNATNYGYSTADNLTQLTSGVTQTFDTANELTNAGYSYDTRGNRTAGATPSCRAPDRLTTTASPRAIIRDSRSGSMLVRAALALSCRIRRIRRPECRACGLAQPLIARFPGPRGALHDDRPR